MKPLLMTHYTLTSALGRGLAATRQALREGASGLHPCDFEGVDLETWIGRVDGLETLPVTGPRFRYDCRNNRLAWLGLDQDGFREAVAAARRRYGADRIGVFLGTSTSGLLTTEMLYQDPATVEAGFPPDFPFRETHDIFSLADFVRQELAVTGPPMVISTACSSSAKVFAEAARFIQAGWCDAAIVGGCDTLCFTTLYGFASLELVSPEPCRPADRDRRGLSIGEAAGFALLERPDRVHGTRGVALLGYGESSDGYHMTAPEPEGTGMAAAMQEALDRAGLASGDISYVNLHGTATRTNDLAEDRGVHKVFGEGTPCSSTKGWTGHTLGAAGITEAIISAICLNEQIIPGSLNTRTLDPEIRSGVTLETRSAGVSAVLSNSFGFGGNNCSLIFGRFS